MSWHSIDDRLEKEMVFENQTQLAEFVLKVAKLSDEQNHHADMQIRYNVLELWLISHDVGKVTKRDHELAKMIDMI
ncbi:MAG: 4a-hydroxytetrahydrobiopterin dehydratase [Crocinitomicaceae bacterium]|nr:4a-hydroxytetrahydrobiopterin dehydratase [Crocinitomicaceae bacterium]